MRRLSLIALIFSCAAAAEAAPRGGVYTNLCVSPETLDQGGTEVQLGLQPTPRGTFAWGAGGCVRSAMNDIRLSGDRISFAVTEHYFTERQAPAGSTIHHYSGRFKARALILISSDDPDFGRVVLHKKRWKPDRLTPKGAAAEQSEWPAPVRRCE